MPNPRISFERQVDDVTGIGVMMRITQAEDGTKQIHLLSRRDGVWVRVTAEMLQEHDIPPECVFPIDELPESVENSGYRPE